MGKVGDRMAELEGMTVSYQQETSMDHKIYVFDAEEGMILSRDVIDEKGNIIAFSGVVLDFSIIAKISDHHVLEIYIFNKEEPVREESTEKTTEKEKDNSTQNTTYYDRVRAGKLFKEFSTRYEKDIDEVKERFNDIIQRNQEINTNELLKSTDELLYMCPNTLQLLDMLHCMRNVEDLTYVHSVNVSIISYIIAKWLNYPKEDIRIITLCGLLHDIGKIMVPKEILTKPGRLNDAEFDIMKQHVNYGYDCIKDKAIDLRVKQCCLLHHEKVDGSGYPFGLKGDQIPNIVKIITIADIYDAMTSSRVYRKPLCPFDVIETMESEAYLKYDPQYIHPVLKNIANSYLHNNVQLSDGRRGEVVYINEYSLGKPVVKCDDQFIDLTKEKSLYITEIL
jgi:putative nucleotidyltransferase with HDIG domain